ncbi:MAG: hypothetical protein K2H12_06545 [Acetatifactor sp.]|nr:hypothetical protein [Acetatifactor sp.]
MKETAVCPRWFAAGKKHTGAAMGKGCVGNTDGAMSWAHPMIYEKEV